MSIQTKFKQLLKNPITWRLMALGVFLGLANVGFADVNKVSEEMEAQVKLIESAIFTKGIRMVVLLLGMCWGFFKTIMAGTLQPLLLYGGIGCMFFFLPKLIELVGSIGG